MDDSRGRTSSVRTPRFGLFPCTSDETLTSLGNRIYVTRTTLAAYYNYRIESLSSRLKEQQTERANTIKKLKEATKYNSTLELLEKYGGAEGKAQPRGDSADDDDTQEGDGRDRRSRHDAEGRSSAGSTGRTNLPPPPTANIQRQQPSPAPGPGHPGPDTAPHQPQGANPPNSIPVTEEFAPNAFAQSPPPPQAYARYDSAAEPHWYDRVLDLLLGEDETAAKNRIVLVCEGCRLVNGQAPPGTRSLGEMGLWKCMGCGAMNGEVDEGTKIVQEVLGARGEGGRRAGGAQSGTEEEIDEEEGGYGDEVEPGVVGNSDGQGGGSARRRKGKK